MENSKINPGEFDTKVNVVSVTQSLGPQGQKRRTVESCGDVWALVEPLTDEMVADDNFESATSVRVTMYKIAGLTTRWQLVIAGVTYEIRSIDPIERWSPYFVLTARTIEQ